MKTERRTRAAWAFTTIRACRNTCHTRRTSCAKSCTHTIARSRLTRRKRCLKNVILEIILLSLSKHTETSLPSKALFPPNKQLPWQKPIGITQAWKHSSGKSNYLKKKLTLSRSIRKRLTMRIVELEVKRLFWEIRLRPEIRRDKSWRSRWTKHRIIRHKIWLPTALVKLPKNSQATNLSSTELNKTPRLQSTRARTSTCEAWRGARFRFQHYRTRRIRQRLVTMPWKGWHRVISRCRILASRSSRISSSRSSKWIWNLRELALLWAYSERVRELL